MIPKWAMPGSHTWLGLFIILAIWVNWVAGAIFAGYFALYERWETDRIGDRAYRSLAQALWGMAIGIVIWGITKYIY